MDQRTVIIVTAVVIIAAAAVVLAWWLNMQKRKRLRARFGPEYDRTVREMRDLRSAEAELATREKRVKHFQLHSLSAADQQRFTSAWRDIQTRFVDDPGSAAAEAEQLLQQVMQARGYPPGEFDETARDVSVHHPQLVQHYRDAHAITVRQEGGQSDTEELRQAIVYYRALFEGLLETRKAA